MRISQPTSHPRFRPQHTSSDHRRVPKATASQEHNAQSNDSKMDKSEPAYPTNQESQWVDLSTLLHVQVPPTITGTSQPVHSSYHAQDSSLTQGVNKII